MLCKWKKPNKIRKTETLISNGMLLELLQLLDSLCLIRRIMSWLKAVRITKNRISSSVTANRIWHNQQRLKEDMVLYLNRENSIWQPHLEITKKTLSLISSDTLEYTNPLFLLPRTHLSGSLLNTIWLEALSLVLEKLLKLFTSLFKSQFSIGVVKGLVAHYSLIKETKLF